MPFSAIPLVNALADFSVPGVLENIRLGLSGQEEANRFFNSLSQGEPFWDDDDFRDEFSDEFGQNDK